MFHFCARHSASNVANRSDNGMAISHLCKRKERIPANCDVDALSGIYQNCARFIVGSRLCLHCVRNNPMPRYRSSVLSYKPGEISRPITSKGSLPTCSPKPDPRALRQTVGSAHDNRQLFVKEFVRCNVSFVDRQAQESDIDFPRDQPVTLKAGGYVRHIDLHSRK